LSDDTTVKRTPTDTLVRCLKEFGKVEPVNVLVIWTDVAGDISWSSSTDSQVIRFGMIEFVKQLLVEQLRNGEGQRTEVVAVDPANPDEDFKGKPN
jgi:hypothetical protein